MTILAEYFLESGAGGALAIATDGAVPHVELARLADVEYGMPPGRKCAFPRRTAHRC
jgi:hypothetical protein